MERKKLRHRRVDIRSHIEFLPIEQLKPGRRKIRKQSPTFVKKIAKSLETFGFIGAVVINGDNEIVTGHALWEACRQLGLKFVPVIRVTHLSEPEQQAFALAHNKLAESGEWNFDENGLPDALKDVLSTDFDFEATGFEHAEADAIVFGPMPGANGGRDERVDANSGQPRVSRLGDLWVLGSHRILCGDALQPSSYALLLGAQMADAVFADGPYGVAMKGHASGKGRTKHREFVMGGAMSDVELRAFYVQYFSVVRNVTRPGAIVYSAIDWRHVAVMQSAAEEAGFELINMVIWTKPNASMGSLYRSGYEIFLVLRQPGQGHRNNVQLGRFGRNRSNVWHHAGANDFGRGGGEGDLLARHPTPKPVPLVAGALLDVTAARDIVLDPFLGSGTSTIAAERTGRCAFGMELDPIYVDVAVRRWEDFTGKEAVHEATGLTFAALQAQREEDSDAA